MLICRYNNVIPMAALQDCAASATRVDFLWRCRNDRQAPVRRISAESAVMGGHIALSSFWPSAATPRQHPPAWYSHVERLRASAAQKPPSARRPSCGPLGCAACRQQTMPKHAG